MCRVLGEDDENGGDRDLPLLWLAQSSEYCRRGSLLRSEIDCEQVRSSNNQQLIAGCFGRSR